MVKQKLKITLTIAFSLLLSIAILSFSSLYIENLAVHATASQFGEIENQFQSVEKLSFSEEKIYSKATLEDDFIGDGVLVVLGRKNSGINKQHKENFFGSFEKRYIKDLTAVEDYNADGSKVLARNIKSKEYINREEFRQIFEIKLPYDDKENVLRVIKQLEANEDILYVGPNYYSYPNAVPNDPHYTANRQWHLNGTYGINAPSAWDITTGASSVKVGVIDTGIANHPDLSANLIGGWDFYNNNNVTTDDLNSHGTSVAGIIGAKGNNGIGVAGIAWNVSLVPLQISYTNPSTGRQTSTNALTIAAINYAKNNNIQILNHSWGGYSYDPAVQSAINSYNGLYVCSAGNGDKNIDNSPYYPASYTGSNIITVGAIKSNGQRPTVSDWGYDSNGQPQGSNYGQNSVDIFAPGCYIGSDLYSTKTGNTYGNFNGTSSSAPMVAGVAALILSKAPGFTAADVKDIIMGNGTYVPALNGLCVNSGLLNAGRAVSAAKNFDFWSSSSSGFVAPIHQDSPVFLADVTGDGRDDFIAISVTGVDTGTVYIAKGNPNGAFAFWTYASPAIIAPGTQVFFDDVTGDGRADLIAIAPFDGRSDAGVVYVATANANGSLNFWTSSSGVPRITLGTRVFMADVNGDKRADMVAVGATPSDTGVVYVATANSNGSFNFWATSSVTPRIPVTSRMFLADVTGNGRADLVAVGAPGSQDDGVVYVATANSNGSFNFWATSSVTPHIPATSRMFLADVTGNGRADLIAIGAPGAHDDGVVYVATANTNGSFNFWASTASGPHVPSGVRVFFADVTGDKRADLVGIGCPNSPDAGKVLVGTANANGSFNIWTTASYSIIVPDTRLFFGDVTGSKRTDLVAIAPYDGRPDAGVVYVGRSF